VTVNPGRRPIVYVDGAYGLIERLLPPAESS
jgi:hypothetical protein